MKNCMAAETMMDKARTVTLIQKLCGERIQIKKSVICFDLFELLSFQSTVLLAFAVFTFFCVDSKNNINYRIFPHAVWLNLFCLNY